MQNQTTERLLTCYFNQHLQVANVISLKRRCSDSPGPKQKVAFRIRIISAISLPFSRKEKRVKKMNRHWDFSHPVAQKTLKMSDCQMKSGRKSEHPCISGVNMHVHRQETSNRSKKSRKNKKQDNITGMVYQ